MKKHLEFLEWLSRFDPQVVKAFVVARRYEIAVGQLGVNLDAEKLALLREAYAAGLFQGGDDNAQLKAWADQTQSRARAGADLLRPANPQQADC